MPTTASIKINGGFAGLADTNLPLGTVVNLSNNDDTGVVSHEWVILSQPAGDQDDLIPPALNPIVSNAPAPQFIPTKEGSYLIKLTVNKGLADEATDTTICAVRELLTGDRIPAPQETTEVSDTDGWATAAVTKILQRVTRLSDAGIFVAQNDSGGDLVLGKVVHMNGMTTIGTGTNERHIPTVDLALANDVAKVDGPLGVVVGNRDGKNETIAVDDLCRVMVMGGIPSYDLGASAAAGDTVYVDDTGTLSLTAGTVVRQVGDVARLVTGTTYDIAISAAANSIPRGSAGGDLTGAYPDPTVAKLQSVSLDGNIATPSAYDVIRYDPSVARYKASKVDLTNTVTGTLPIANGGTGGIFPLTTRGIVYATSATALATTTAGLSGQPLLSQGSSNPVFAALALNGANSVIGNLPVSNGGTGSGTALVAGGILYSQTSSVAISTPAATGVGYVLCSNASSPSGVPQWVNVVPVAHGGTGDSSLTLNGVLYGNGTAAVGQTAAASAGAILTGTIAGVPTWKTAGSAGQILTLVNILPGVEVLDWQDFAAYFDAQYAGSTVSTDALFSTTGGAFSEIVATTRSCKRGMVQVTPMPITDGAAFINHITTATNGTYSTVSLKYVVTFPDVPATVQNYLYQFRSSTSSNNNQNTGSITFPSLTFYTSLEGDHTVSLQATISPSGDTFTVNAIALRISQG